MDSVTEKTPVFIHWFRADCLRLNDNPSLNKCLEELKQVDGELMCMFILDPSFLSPINAGPSVNVWRFLVESLRDLNEQLMDRYKKPLRIFCGDPSLILGETFRAKPVKMLSFQASQASYESHLFDDYMKQMCATAKVKVCAEYSHTLFSPDTIYRVSKGKTPVSYCSFRQLLPQLGRPEQPVTLTDLKERELSDVPKNDNLPYEIDMPELQDFGFGEDERLYSGKFIGGEVVGLQQLSKFSESRINMSKDLSGWLTMEDSLSPYIRFGCVSVRQIFHQLNKLVATNRNFISTMVKNFLLREFAYCVAFHTPKFDRMVGNQLCIQLPWDQKPELESRVLDAQTGFPWIDAIIMQCRNEGWTHYVARKCLAIFLTRGYLWISWVFGKEFFQDVMLDFEMPVSCVCWMQDSCSGFFSDTIESLDPIEIGRKMDPKGEYIKKYLPKLKNIPAEYIHAPWLAPSEVQKEAECIIGKDYPKPVVDVCTQGKLCCARIEAIMSALEDTYAD